MFRPSGPAVDTDTSISRDGIRTQPDSEFPNGSVDTEQYRPTTAPLESIGHTMTNDLPQRVLHESSGRLRENSQLPGPRHGLLVDDQRQLHHDDSMVSGDEPNPGPDMNHIHPGGQEPNSVPRAGGTLQFPDTNMSEGDVNVNYELESIVNGPADSWWSNICSPISFDDPQPGIAHRAPGADGDMDFIMSDSYIPSVHQPRLIDDLVYSSSISDSDFLDMFSDMCAPYESCPPGSMCDIPNDWETQTRIDKSPFGHSEMDPNAIGMDDHCNHYQYDNQPGQSSTRSNQ
jgi:hypothetical protein